MVSKKKSKKKSRKKPVLITFLIIVILIAAGIGYILTNLNSIVKTAIEKYGSKATQTAVRVQKVDISLKEGSCGISALTIANPAGFKMENCFSLGEVLVDIDLASLRGEEIGLEEIVVRDLEVFVEVNSDNKNNLNELKKNLPESGAPAEADKTDAAGKEPKLHIHHILFQGGKISALVVPLKNKTYDLKMPVIEMRNLRGTSTEITKQILDKLTKKALAAVKKQGIGFLEDKYGDQVEKELKKQKAKIADELSKKLKL